MPGAQVFISHSRLEPHAAFFHQAFAMTNLRAVWFEFENPPPPAWSWIRDNVRASKAVFVLLSRPMALPGFLHTQNWVAWEAGLACAFGKPVVVFEPQGEPVEFAVPFCTRQVLYDHTEPQHSEWLRDELRRLEREWFPTAPENAHCPECGLSWHQYNEDVRDFPCPSCRTRLLPLDDGGGA